MSRALVIGAFALLLLSASYSKAEDITEVCRAGTPDKAIPACDIVVSGSQYTREQTGEAYIARCQHYYEKDNYDHAIKDCTTAISFKPKWLQLAYGDRANAHYMKGEKLLAIADYTMAISLDSDYSAAHTGRALLYEQDGLYDKAREGFRDAMRAKSAFADDDWAHKTAQEHLEKLKDK